MPRAVDADVQRAELLERWERNAKGWAARADENLAQWMPVSDWMIDRLELQPGERVLELAAGPGDTGFLAAELVSPGGTLLCSDATDGMLEVARARAGALGVANVEFKRLELEWIDLPTASVDAILCRWGLMFAVDPQTALGEMRRVLRPGGRMALAVWDEPASNPWATVPTRALVTLGHAEPPDPSLPGMFALSDRARLRDLIEHAGFGDVVIEAVALRRENPSVEAYIAQTLDLSGPFAELFGTLSEPEAAEVRASIASLAQPYTRADGSLSLPASALVAAAGA